MKFRKKPVVIEAMKFTGDNLSECLHFMGEDRFIGNPELHETDYPTIHTLEGDMTASPGDWIIRGVKGEYYPCKPDIFESTYEDAATRAPDPLLGLLREAREALKALLVMMDRGDKPRKLDETLTWVQNDLKARAMASGALTRLDAALAETPKAGEGK